MSEWQPIETAPKDFNHEVLTYRKAGLQSVASYHQRMGWVCTDGVGIVDVTHWMPLPEPPK